MKSYELKAQPRLDLGKKATKALRQENLIPAVLNGGKVVELKDGKYDGKLEKGQKVVPIGRDNKAVLTTDITVSQADVRKLIFSPDVFIVDLNIDGVAKKAVVKDVQWHKVKDTVLHIDFLEINDKKPVVVEIPVKIEGHAAGVKAGGKLYLGMKKVKVKGLYPDLPERVIVNVDDIQIGHSIKVCDLKFDKYELVSAKDLVITGVRATRGSATAAAEEGEAEEEA